MPLNLENQPYININSNGITSKCTDLASQGWHKEIIFKGIFGRSTFYEPVIGQPTKLKSYSSYVYRIFKVKSGVCPICKEALEREKIQESACRIRKMGIRTGLYRRCFIGACGNSQDFTDWFMNWDSPNWKLIKEVPVSLNEVIDLFKKGEIDFISDYGLLAAIGERLGYDLN